MANRLTAWLSPALRRQRLRVARMFVASGQVLDYGCGIGALADLVPAGGACRKRAGADYALCHHRG
jgi:2-polyprenyl-3-methyl-5-hydroxy-6-metoxy-1,4-benzoquinol methylase